MLPQEDTMRYTDLIFDLFYGNRILQKIGKNTGNQNADYNDMSKLSRDPSLFPACQEI